MAGKFSLKKISDIDLDDAFFDTLKSDYPGFEDWFQKLADNGSTALVFEDELGVGAFVALKENEEEEIILQTGKLPTKKRIKVRTFRIAERYRRLRIGEGAIGLFLWKWMQSDAEEIYVTVFAKQTTLISQLERFGFTFAGVNANGENVYIKNRKTTDFTDPCKAFPFIGDNFDYAGYIIIDDTYHDNMFAYSELANNISLQTKISNSVSNGLSKIYVGQAPRPNHYIGEPVLIYRRYTQGNGKRYRSCVTSYCIVTDIIQAKVNNRYLMSFDELKAHIGNKSVFNEHELYRQYITFRNVIVVEMLYVGYFGSGNNVNMDWLDRNGFWAVQNQYPTEVRLTPDQFKAILAEGNVNVSNVVIHQS